MYILVPIINKSEFYFIHLDSLEVRETQYLGFRPFEITHFNTISQPFVTGSDESGSDYPRGWQAGFPTLPLLRRSPSAQSSSVFLK